MLRLAASHHKPLVPPLILIIVLLLDLNQRCHCFVPFPSKRHRLFGAGKLGMFTGIVEEMGTVSSVVTKENIETWDGGLCKGVELQVAKPDIALDGAYLGCSISVSGVCLTATSLEPLTFGLAPETLEKSNLGDLRAGDKVNLERASLIGGRNSGHMVQGHVDCVGEISSKSNLDDSLFLTISLPSAFVRYVVPKGFIAIDGTSLTVCEVDQSKCTFTVMLVSYTQKKIILTNKPVGATVNLEVDVMGKYAESAMAGLTQRVDELQKEVDDLKERLRG